MAEAKLQAWILFELRRSDRESRDIADFIEKKALEYGKLAEIDKNDISAATIAVIDAETKLRECKARLPASPLTESDISIWSSITARHKACVKFNIALVALVAVQKRIGIDQATQDWTQKWQLEVGNDDARAHDERQRLTNIDKLESALPTASHWTGGWVIGSGSFAKAYLYVQHDDNGTITNRVVAKDTNYDGLDAWNWECNWYITLEGQRVPMEVKTMFDLRGRRGSEYILKIINWRLSMENSFLRIYTAFAPLGDLLDLIEPYIKGGQSIPEAYVWHVFECLAIAGLLMERDLKLENVFLDHPSKTCFRRYPTPKIADFKAAVYASKNPPRNSDYYNAAGTPDNFPVEQHPTFSSRVVSSKINVWGVANTVGSLIWQTIGYDGLNFGEEPGGLSEPAFNDAQTKTYSEELRALILQCMRYDQDDRPGFSTLLRLIRKAKRAGLDGGLENELFDGSKWTAQSLLIDMKDVNYPIAQEHLEEGEESDDDIGGPPGTELTKISSGVPFPPGPMQPAKEPDVSSSSESSGTHTALETTARKASETAVRPTPSSIHKTLGERGEQPSIGGERPEPNINQTLNDVLAEMEQSRPTDQDSAEINEEVPSNEDREGSTGPVPAQGQEGSPAQPDPVIPQQGRGTKKRKSVEKTAASTRTKRKTAGEQTSTSGESERPKKAKK